MIPKMVQDPTSITTLTIKASRVISVIAEKSKPTITQVLVHTTTTRGLRWPTTVHQSGALTLRRLVMRLDVTLKVAQALTTTLDALEIRRWALSLDSAGKLKDRTSMAPAFTSPTTDRS